MVKFMKPKAGDKYAIMSDAHANPRALATALADARKRGCGRFLLLGDITGYGYDVKATLKVVREKFDIVLMGNHDSACVGLEPSWEVMAISNYDIDRAQREQLTDEEIGWIRKREHVYSEKDAAFVHGDFTNPKAWNYIFTTESAVKNFFSRGERLLFCGHTHHAAVWEATSKGEFGGKLVQRLAKPATKVESLTFKLKKGSRYVINVGSVGYPRNDLCCSYCIYDPGKASVTIRRLPFDFKNYIMEMLDHKIDLPLWLCEILLAAQGKMK